MAEHCPEGVAWDLEMMTRKEDFDGTRLTIWSSLLSRKLLPHSIFKELEDKGLENSTLLFHLQRQQK